MGGDPVVEALRIFARRGRQIREAFSFLGDPSPIRLPEPGDDD